MNALLPPNFSLMVGNYVTKTLDIIINNMSWPVMFLMFAGFVAGLIVLYFLYKKYGLKIKILEKFTGIGDDSDGADQTEKEAEIMLFHVDWCPHCKTAKPEWDKFKAEVESNGGLINGRRVIFTEYNCTKETDEIVKITQKYKIEGYPTIKLLKDEQIIEFDAKPSKATLQQFLSSVL
jgi:thiol-disulfide isomerase/thioredoxin